MSAPAVATDEHLLWIAGRAAGIVALLASGASVSLGLGTRPGAGRGVRAGLDHDLRLVRPRHDQGPRHL